MLYKSIDDCEIDNFLKIIDSNSPENLDNKEKYSQFYTPVDVAMYMANFFKLPNKKKIEILDPCCGEGNLIICFLLNLVMEKNIKIKEVVVTAYEIDSELIEKLNNNLSQVAKYCSRNGLEIKYRVLNENFITNCEIENKYNYIILNPPYMKLGSDSKDNERLIDLGINVPNYYSAFVSLCKRVLKKNGEIVAITPRSFCNGIYYLWFRKDIASDMTFDKIHLFESRRDIFKNDDILQESIIYHCINKKAKNGNKVKIIYSDSNKFTNNSIIERRFDDVIYPNDKNYIIRILKDNKDEEMVKKVNLLSDTLDTIDIQVSTGPVVDFRQPKDALSKQYVNGSIPIFFSEHLRNSNIEWPKVNAKKYNYILSNDKNKNILRYSGNYVLVKRMTSKEEKRRIVSCVCEGERFSKSFLTFDNKINYFHRRRKGLPLSLAKGLSIYLNSTMVDMYFRTFSGNTQVNVTDLRSLKYPNEKDLIKLSLKYNFIYKNQELIDKAVEEIVLKNNEF